MDRGFAEKAARLRQELYGEYGPFYYVPMAESRAVQVPVTVGCSYGRCLFCDLNQGMRYRELPLGEIADNVEKLRFIHGRDRRPVRRCLLAGGNPLSLPTEKLLRIAEKIRSAFPEVEYISGFARADDVLAKTEAELRSLSAAGYDRLCLGIESGSDRVLRYQEKGVGRLENASAMRALDCAGMRYSVYVMLGLGGRALSEEHIEETAGLLNAARPFELTVVTLVLFKGAGLASRVRAGEFKRLRPLESLMEGRRLLSLLEIPTVYDGTHKTNAFPIKGRLPEHRDRLLRRMDRAVELLGREDVQDGEIRRWRNWFTE
ncbi:MAG: radical SAM protein [Fretibacterium sp.]|nr:radical SAM protein [Fretibacterium sp.]